MRTAFHLASLLLAGTMSVSAVQAEESPAALSPDFAERLRYWTEHYRSPADYVLEKFQTRKWIFLGEYHRIKHDVDLVTALIPRLHKETDVRHLALEFLCRNLTEEATELISAAEWNRKRAIDFFRSQFPGWHYEEYLEIFKAAWQSNRKLGETRGAFRLVGLHPCPDYEVVHFSDDEAAVEREQDKQRRYDEIMAEALEERVLKPGVKALIVLGVAHSTAKFQEYWFGTDKPLRRMGNLVYRPPYKDEMFFVCLHAPFWDAGTQKDIYPFDGVLDRLMREFGRDLGFDVVGSPFENLEHAIKSPRAITKYRFGELYDGYIIHKTPLKKTMGVTCIRDWISSEEEYRYYWRHLSNKRAALVYSEMPFAEFKRDLCSANSDHGVGFKRRFRGLPDL